jgi:hypothetical protein
MSHPTLWPKEFYYPVGNTAAVCLTDNLPPEKSANVLLLGCGDPRNILYTLYADPLIRELRFPRTKGCLPKFSSRLRQACRRIHML